MNVKLYLEGFNGIFGIFLLPDTDNGVCDENEENDKGFNKGGDAFFFVVFKKGQDE